MIIPEAEKGARRAAAFLRLSKKRKGRVSKNAPEELSALRAHFFVCVSGIKIFGDIYNGGMWNLTRVFLKEH